MKTLDQYRICKDVDPGETLGTPVAILIIDRISSKIIREQILKYGDTMGHALET